MKTYTVHWIQMDGPRAGELQTQVFYTEIEAIQHRQAMDLYTNTYLTDGYGNSAGAVPYVHGAKLTADK